MAITLPAISRRLPWLCLLAACIFTTTAHADCVIHPIATVPLNVSGGTIMLPLEVNGITASFVLDTGAQRSIVNEAAISRLDLARDQWVGTTMSGIGGVNNRANAIPRSLSLAHIALSRRTLTHDTSLAVAVLPLSNASGSPIDGLLGRDYLSLFDLDLNVAAHRLILYQPTGCAGRFLPWTGTYTAVPVTNPAESALVVPVVLDGTPLRALLDTGSSGSILAAPGIYRLGLDLAELGADPGDPVKGLGAHTVTMRRHRFRTLGVGVQTVDAPLIWVAPLHLSPIVDMVLGADWMAGRRLWISYATRQLFVAAP